MTDEIYLPCDAICGNSCKRMEYDKNDVLNMLNNPNKDSCW